MKTIRYALLGLLVAGGAPLPAAAAPVILKVAHFLPTASAAHSQMIVPWCEKIKSESNGGLECQIFPAMQLGGTPGQLFGQARDGVADIVWTLPGYTPGRFPVSEVFELPFFSTTHEASSRALWDFIQEHAQNEFKGVKPIATWINGPNYLHLRDKQVQTLDDLKGMKVRAPSRLSNKLLTTLGASAMGMPLPQAVESFSKGVIDAAMLPWEVIPGVKLDELAKYHAEVVGAGTMATSTMIYVMNQRKYDSLPAELRKVIDDNSGQDTSAWVANQFKAADERGRAAALKRGNVVYQIAPEEVQKWKEASAPVTQEWIQEISAKGLDGQALHDEAKALVVKYGQ